MKGNKGSTAFFDIVYKLENLPFLIAKQQDFKYIK